MQNSALHQIYCRKFSQGTWHEIQDVVPPEVQIHIRWPDSTHSLWAFPHELHDLALGHAALELCAPREEPVYINHQETTFTLRPSLWEGSPVCTPRYTLSAETILNIMHSFLERSGLWEQTGCFHRMAAYAPQPAEFCCFVEDIGRHNCVDRLAGWALKNAQHLQTTVLLCSSRVTGSLMSKISRAGFPMVISRSATTQAAILQAQAKGITLVGFTRENRCTVFCDPDNRVVK